MPDEALMAACKQGNHAAFDELMTRYNRAVTNFIYRYVNDYELTKELVQETFVAVFKAVGKYEPQAKFTTWLFSIARNQALKARRTAARHPTDVLPFDEGTEHVFRPGEEETGRPDQNAIRAEDCRRFTAAFAQLPDIYQEVVRLRVFQDLPHAEIARILAVQEATVRSRMRDALKRLHAAMG